MRWLVLVIAVGCSHAPPIERSSRSRSEPEVDLREVTAGAVELSIHAGTRPARVHVKRVELIAGARTGIAVPSAPTVWESGGTYEPWNEQIGADEVMAVRYALSAPDWGGTPPGRIDAHRVAIQINGYERVFDGMPRDSWWRYPDDDDDRDDDSGDADASGI